eukprot:CAMPEP_0114162022 /NCGR_PEP_ID=MMETSP0043_2-20121206/29274_1 /TAXON_ID=464988 /ORGANISM="Hemiselmis andersenii, Strain CCMP644" /LENGTH=532 /DNA_ID=CAMNT_0001258311 /DNA_START=238 /DNA_END=1836 /DNA_ORIENTATION=+
MKMALETTASGWVGFGLAEMGRMPGADIVYYETSTNTLTDAYALGFTTPVSDSCQSWALVAAETVGGKMRVEMSRPLTNEDPSDRNFVDDSAWPLEPTKVIGAWGNTAAMQYHGASSRVQTSVRFFGSGGADPIASLNANAAASDFMSFLLRPSSASNGGSSYTLPAQKTDYKYFTYPLATALGVSNASAASAVHMVAAEAVVTSGNAAYVHHFVLEACTGSACDNNGQCDKLWAWAPGAPDFVLPAAAGIRLLGAGYNCLRIQTHYDNPALSSTITDDSGIRIYATKAGAALRGQDAGMVVMGDELVVEGLTLPAGYSSTEFQSGTCTSLFADSEVTVFAELLHMHAHGKAMLAQVERGGQVVRSARVDYYDFDAAGIFTNPSVGAGFKLQKGDVYRVKCFYDTQQQTNIVFGLGSEDEMCMSFLSYYPKQGGLSVADCSPNRDKSIQATTGASFVGGSYATVASLVGFGRVFADQSASFTCPPLPVLQQPTTTSAPPTTTPQPGMGSAVRMGAARWLTTAGALLAIVCAR